MSFPKINSNKLKGLSGQAYFQYLVNNYLKCIYYPTSEENDFGIDGYIGVVSNEEVTGKLIGVQVKYGNSYFKNETNQGYKYFGDIKHLNYYSNSQEPIFIIIMNDDFSKMNWVQFDIKKSVILNETRWWIEIPKENEIEVNLKEALLNSVSPVIDFDEKVKSCIIENFSNQNRVINRPANFKILGYKETQKKYEEIGRVIREKRRDLRMSQEKLAEMIDIAPSYISEIERGTSMCSLNALINIASVLGLRLDSLVSLDYSF